MVIERLGGNLVPRSIYYSMSPDGKTEFFGSTGVVLFLPDESSKTINIVVANDDKPEVIIVKSRG